MRGTPWHKRLVSQAMALQLLVIAVVLIIVSAAFARTGQSALEEQYGLRAQSIAESVAEIPDVRSLVAERTIDPKLQEIAEGVRVRTDVTFVVITDDEGIRYSHPNPERIGQVVSTDPGRALAGISDWYVQTGTLGPSVRGKVPIWGQAEDRIVGIVSVGILSGEVSETLQDRFAGLLLAAAVAFTAGAVAAYLGARRIRRQTLGLEPPEIARLFEHREVLLGSLHEGILAVDQSGYVTLINAEAETMLDLDSQSDPRPVHERQELQPLAALADASSPQVDVPIQVGGQMLLVTCVPIAIRNRREGAVFTLRDRTELQGLVSELESAQGLIDALRAQAHEHSNSLHTIAGLIELGRHEHVLAVVSDHASSQRELADLYDHRGGADSLIVASLLAKAARAGERDVRLRTHLGDLPQTEVRLSRDLVTVVGNLVDNAVDHLSETHLSGGEVEIGIWYGDGAIRIDVSDSGQGIEQEFVNEIFEPGYTTKDTRSHDGLGLALVAQVVEDYGGTISVDTGEGSGTLFSVTIPHIRDAELARV